MRRLTYAEGRVASLEVRASHPPPPPPPRHPVDLSRRALYAPVYVRTRRRGITCPCGLGLLLCRSNETTVSAYRIMCTRVRTAVDDIGGHERARLQHSVPSRFPAPRRLSGGGRYPSGRGTWLHYLYNYAPYYVYSTIRNSRARRSIIKCLCTRK